MIWAGASDARPKATYNLRSKPMLRSERWRPRALAHAHRSEAKRTNITSLGDLVAEMGFG
uniref:Uncharacterized protein n=1 Tax=Fagus sylvatica TaxID=28930 RepID=A0A2N9GV95_FAGSY